MKCPQRRTNSALAIFSVIFAMAMLSIVLLVVGDVAIVQAQTVDTPTTVPSVASDEGLGVGSGASSKKKKLRYPNIDSNLNRIIEQVQTGRLTTRAAAATAPIHRDESVAATLHIAEGHAQDVWDWLEASGASPRNSGVDYIEAYISASLLPEASEREGVVSIRTIFPAEPTQGRVISEGVGLHGATAWHEADLKGKGVKIAIIDVGFQGFQSLMGTELPSTVEARCYTDIGVFTSNLSDCDSSYTSKHGTAVTEAAFDIAPEATYYIVNVRSEGDLVSSIEWLIEHDVDVINMSLVWVWSGPGDGTSPYSDSPLRSVDAAVAGGITWMNGAGNGTRKSWFGAFTDLNDDEYHEFADSDQCNAVQLTAGYGYLFQLRWDDSWYGATNDLELELFQGSSVSESGLVATSTAWQDGRVGAVPFEGFRYNPGSSGTYCIAVKYHSGLSPDWIQLEMWSRGAVYLERHTLSHSIASPAESANSGMLAVGAAPASDTSTIESFSGRGPTPDGRVKPGIVGADKANSKTWGRWSGTSQSSPHVAGLGGLVKQRFPTFTPQQIVQYLKTNAEERGEEGSDNTWGHGFAKLPAADAEEQSLSGPVTGLTATATHNTVSLSWDAPSDGATVTGYKILRRAVQSEDSFQVLSADTGDTNTTWTDSDVSARTKYAYRVRALSEQGESSLSMYVSVLTLRTPLPGRVAALTATATHNTVSLSWDAPSDGATVTGYTILRRAVDSEQDYQVLRADTGDTSTTWTDSDVSARTKYSYRVRALGESGQGNLSTLASVTTDFVPLPGRVTGVTATATHDTVSLIWDAPTDGAAVTGYKILRRAVDSEQDYRVLSADTGDTSATWTDSDVSARTKYAYRVRALSESGQGNLSTLASVTTDFVPPPRVENSPATGAPDITGTAQVGETLTADTSDISDADGLTNATFSYQWLADDADITGATSSTYTLSNDDEGKAVKVRVSFTDDAGNNESLASTATTAVVAAAPEPTPEPTPPSDPPDKPAGLSMDTEFGSLSVSVDWDDVSGAADYLVRWRPHGSGQKLNDGVRTTASAARITVAGYGKWVVRVVACNDAGCGPQSTRQVVVKSQPNRAPVVDDQAEQYAGFIGVGNAPRGTLVSKLYEGIFSDPDGDTLTYAVSVLDGDTLTHTDSVPADRGALVDTVYVHEDTQRVFIRLDADGDWGAVTPALTNPLVTTVTLTATDPDGLSVSLTGEFHTQWDSTPTKESAQ